jgi:threonine synthase
MEYISLANPFKSYSFREVVQKSIADDGSLFVPKDIPQIDPSILSGKSAFDVKEIAFQILSPFVGSDLNKSQLEAVIDHTFQFELPIIKLQGRVVYRRTFPRADPCLQGCRGTVPGRLPETMDQAWR